MAAASLSYVAWAADDMQEHLSVEPSTTVGEFVEKVRGEFFLDVTQLSYEKVNLLALARAGERLADIVPPGSRVLVNTREQAALRAMGVETGAPAEAPPAEPVEEAPRLQLGDVVQIVGLQGRPELNGRRGKLERWVAAKERWEVRLGGKRSGDPPLGLKPANLERAEPEPTKLAGGFLSGGLGDKRSAARGALVVLCNTGETEASMRAKLEGLQLPDGGTFEERLEAVGIQRLVFVSPKGADSDGRDVDWFDRKAMRSPEVPEDLSGIAHSMEQVDAEVDNLVKEHGFVPARVGLLGHGSGSCMALHLAYGAGRHAKELGAVACARGFLSRDSVCYSAAAGVWRSGSGAHTKPSPALFLSHGAADSGAPKAWLDMTRCHLGAAGVRAPQEVVSYPGAGSELCAAELQAMVAFFAQSLLAD